MTYTGKKNTYSGPLCKVICISSEMNAMSGADEAGRGYDDDNELDELG